MKRTLSAAILLLSAWSVNAQVKMPAGSPTQKITQEFAIGKIELTYSRPSAKGRKIFGDLVPFGKLWRTGANAATQIKFTDAVEFGGKKIDTGTYAVYTIPGLDSWEIILNKGTKNWGIDGYSESDDVVRIKTESKKLKDMVETFTMGFTDLKPESCNFVMKWEKTAISIPITTNLKEKLRANIIKGMEEEKKPYWQAAQFYNEYDKDLPKALENIKMAVETNPKAYWIWIYKARIEKEMGNKVAAKASAEMSLKLAQEDRNDDYVKINETFLKEL
jgi:hypothetical protein